MCFTIPKKILTTDGTHATIEGNTVVDVSGVGEHTAGDYVVVTSGIAIQRLMPDEALSMRSLVKQTHDELS
jgi:hydrogenase maturation factor